MYSGVTEVSVTPHTKVTLSARFLGPFTLVRGYGNICHPTVDRLQMNLTKV